MRARVVQTVRVECDRCGEEVGEASDGLVICGGAYASLEAIAEAGEAPAIKAVGDLAGAAGDGVHAYHWACFLRACGWGPGGRVDEARAGEVWDELFPDEAPDGPGDPSLPPVKRGPDRTEAPA